MARKFHARKEETKNGIGAGTGEVEQTYAILRGLLGLRLRNASRARSYGLRFVLQLRYRAAKIPLGQKKEMCYDVFAFVALVKPLESFKGAASPNLRPLCVLRLEAVERHQIA
jgi:hypothetical protein